MEQFRKDINFLEKIWKEDNLDRDELFLTLEKNITEILKNLSRIRSSGSRAIDLTSNIKLEGGKISTSTDSFVLFIYNAKIGEEKETEEILRFLVPKRGMFPIFDISGYRKFYNKAKKQSGGDHGESFFVDPDEIQKELNKISLPIFLYFLEKTGKTVAELKEKITQSPA